MIKSTWISSAILLVLCSTSLAQTSQDNSDLGFAAQVRELGGDPSGIVPLLRLWRSRHHSEPARIQEALAQLSGDRRINANTRRYAQVLEARAQIERGDVDGSGELISRLGYVNDWQVLGPLDNEGKLGFERTYPVESNLLEAPDPQSSYEGRDRLINWQPYHQHRSLGYIDFAAGMRPQRGVCAYAQTVIHSERIQPLSLWVGAGGAIRIWWNGEEVFEDPAYRSPDPERSVAHVGAHRGANRVTLKVCNAASRWGFFFRVGDAQGNAARGIRVDAQSADVPASGHSRARRARGGTVSSFDSLQEAAEADSSTAEDWEALARFMRATGADDSTEGRALQLAERAATNSPTVSRLVLVTQLLSERSQITGWLNRAITLSADDPAVLLLQARIMLGSPNPEEAIPLLDLHDPTPGQRRAAERVRASIYRELDLHQAAYRVIHDAYANTPSTAHGLGLRAGYAVRAGYRDEAVAAYERLLELNHLRSDAREYLIEDAIRRDEFPRAAALLDTAYTLGRHSVRALKYVSRTRESIGDDEGALAAIEAARNLAPDDAGVLIAEGQLHLRAGRDGEAALAFEAALRLRPQDAETREQLAQLQPAERPDERYAVPLDALLERRVARAAYPSTTLQNLTVNTVYPNGLGSSFKQLAAQIHTEDGARQWRTYQIQFDPTSQRVDLRVARVIRQNGTVLEAVQSFERQMGEPWYRIYYDTRAKVVVFPDLHPGDTVEVQYRVDDVAHTNLFADYYGDLHILQNFQPITNLDYVLITPREREFFFNEPELPSLERSVREEGEERIFHYRAENIEALRREAGMPGFTQVAPYLHVSTYRTWDEVGRWYWGLIQDQLYADENLEAVVQELVADADTVAEKVARIYGWVIRNTRYVGLEFGIHGFKPYRVPLVLRRGFGDCKDKASILYTMLREAGIDAHIVLTRTRRNGDIGELPASLAVFDHAIAYVPELDLYLDGTAEHSGSRELPRMDQGVTVLHVWPSGSELRRTPVLPPEENSRHRVLHLQLQADGSARARVEERVQGTGASTFRNQFQAVGTRVERMQRSMRQLFPGITIDELDFDSDLEDLEAPVSFSYEANIPRLVEIESGGTRLAPSVITELGGQIARSSGREHDLDLGGTSRYIEERHVELPPGSTIASRPAASMEEESDFGRLSITNEVEGSTIHTRTELVFNRDRISVEDYGAFREWVGRVDRRLRERIEITGGVR